MTVLEIVLLIIGVSCVIGSFFISEKLSSGDREKLQKLTKEQIEDIIKDKMADAKVEMEDVLSERIDQAMEELDRKTDKETTDKIMQISEYSDSVLESVNQSHTEVMFMYSMLNEKHTSVTEMTKDLSQIKDSIVTLDSSISKKLDLLRDKENELSIREQEIIKQEEEIPKQTIAQPQSFTERLAEKFADERTVKSNNNMEILTLHDEGLSEVEIAKKLGRGLGEVKFVLGLYQED